MSPQPPPPPPPTTTVRVSSDGRTTYIVTVTPAPTNAPTGTPSTTTRTLIQTTVSSAGVSSSTFSRITQTGDGTSQGTILRTESGSLTSTSAVRAQSSSASSTFLSSSSMPASSAAAAPSSAQAISSAAPASRSSVAETSLAFTSSQGRSTAAPASSAAAGSSSVASASQSASQSSSQGAFLSTPGASSTFFPSLPPASSAPAVSSSAAQVASSAATASSSAASASSSNAPASSSAATSSSGASSARFTSAAASSRSVPASSSASQPASAEASSVPTLSFTYKSTTISKEGDASTVNVEGRSSSQGSTYTVTTPRGGKYVSSTEPGTEAVPTDSTPDFTPTPEAVIPTDSSGKKWVAPVAGVLAAFAAAAVGVGVAKYFQKRRRDQAQNAALGAQGAFDAELRNTGIAIDEVNAELGTLRRTRRGAFAEVSDGDQGQIIFETQLKAALKREPTPEEIKAAHLLFADFSQQSAGHVEGGPVTLVPQRRVTAGRNTTQPGMVQDALEVNPTYAAIDEEGAVVETEINAYQLQVQRDVDFGRAAVGGQDAARSMQGTLLMASFFAQYKSVQLQTALQAEIIKFRGGAWADNDNRPLPSRPFSEDIKAAAARGGGMYESVGGRGEGEDYGDEISHYTTADSVLGGGAGERTREQKMSDDFEAARTRRAATNEGGAGAAAEDDYQQPRGAAEDDQVTGVTLGSRFAGDGKVVDETYQVPGAIYNASLPGQVPQPGAGFDVAAVPATNTNPPAAVPAPPPPPIYTLPKKEAKGKRSVEPNVMNPDNSSEPLAPPPTPGRRYNDMEKATATGDEKKLAALNTKLPPKPVLPPQAQAPASAPAPQGGGRVSPTTIQENEV